MAWSALQALPHTSYQQECPYRSAESTNTLTHTHTSLTTPAHTQGSPLQHMHKAHHSHTRTRLTTPTHTQVSPHPHTHKAHHSNTCTRLTTPTHAQGSPLPHTHTAHHSHTRTSLTTHTHTQGSPLPHSEALVIRGGHEASVLIHKGDGVDCS